MDLFKTHSLTYLELIDLVLLTEDAEGPDITESEHYKKVYGIGIEQPHIVANGTKLTPLSIKNNPKLIERLVNFTGIDSNSIHSLHLIDYPLGSNLNTHLDSRSSHTFVFILENAFKGGDVIMQDKIYKFDAGTILEYNGQKVMHGVTKIEKGTRQTLVMWYGHKSTTKSVI
tara:strand:+ start:17 stop:532 length:516 start_codon:yes stop_codon:yes gene_type:complete